MWFKKKTLIDVLNLVKQVKVHGIKFKIKKINPLDYVDGSKVLVQVYETYGSTGKDMTQDPGIMKKIKAHYADVFMSAVIEPKLARKPEDEGIFVENLFTDWTLVEDLYNEVITYAYGKKKLKR